MLKARRYRSCSKFRTLSSSAKRLKIGLDLTELQRAYRWELFETQCINLRFFLLTVTQSRVLLCQWGLQSPVKVSFPNFYGCRGTVALHYTNFLSCRCLLFSFCYCTMLVSSCDSFSFFAFPWSPKTYMFIPSLESSPLFCVHSVIRFLLCLPYYC